MFIWTNLNIFALSRTQLSLAYHLTYRSTLPPSVATPIQARALTIGLHTCVKMTYRCAAWSLFQLPKKRSWIRGVNHAGRCSDNSRRLTSMVMESVPSMLKKKMYVNTCWVIFLSLVVVHIIRLNSFPPLSLPVSSFAIFSPSHVKVEFADLGTEEVKDMFLSELSDGEFEEESWMCRKRCQRGYRLVAPCSCVRDYNDDDDDDAVGQSCQRGTDCGMC